MRPLAQEVHTMNTERSGRVPAAMAWTLGSDEKSSGKRKRANQMLPPINVPTTTPSCRVRNSTSLAIALLPCSYSLVRIQHRLHLCREQCQGQLLPDQVHFGSVRSSALVLLPAGLVKGKNCGRMTLCAGVEMQSRQKEGACPAQIACHKGLRRDVQSGE